jgi:hypothetical protein
MAFTILWGGMESVISRSFGVVDSRTGIGDMSMCSSIVGMSCRSSQEAKTQIS